MNVVDFEIARHDWASMSCGCGKSAAHVPEDLRRLARARSDGEANLHGLTDHVTFVVHHEPSVPAVSVALAALAADTAPAARRCFLALLLCLMGDDGNSFAAAAQGRDLPAECVDAARKGLWLLYRELLSTEDVDARAHSFEILSLIDEDRDRVRHVRDLLRDRLPWHLQGGYELE